MGNFFDFFKKKEILPDDGKIRLTKEEIADQLRLACWDLFISNLPKPKIIDTQRDRNVPAEYKEGVPSGFSISPDTWVTYFNSDDLPDFPTRQDGLDHTRSIGQHENMHFINVPGSKRMHVRLVDAAIKGLQNSQDNRKGEVAHLTVNIFGDWAGDYLLGVDKFGREDFSTITRERIRRTTEQVSKEMKQNGSQHSPLWKVLVGTYERMFNDNFNLSKYAPLTGSEQSIVNQCVEIMGSDFKNSDVWPEKVGRLARTLEGIINQSSNQAQQQNKSGKGQRGSGSGGQGGGMPMPDDVKGQMGPHPTQNQYKKGGKGEKEEEEGKGLFGKKKEPKEGDENQEKIDAETLDEVYRINKNNPSAFAGTVGALAPITPEESMRLMYRMRARDYLIKITAKKEFGRYSTPGAYKTWNVGDPMLGRGGLELSPSIIKAGVPIPGLTTIKRQRQMNELPGRARQIADLFWIIDSSGSMGWDPTAQNEESRGEFDKAIIAAEAATLYALDHGAKVAGINFSGRDNSGTRMVKKQDFTTNLGKLEETLMLRYGDGTIFPEEDYNAFLKKNQSRVMTAIISDLSVDNPEESARVITKYANPLNPVYVFHLGGGVNSLFNLLNDKPGVVIYPIIRMNDLRDRVMGPMKEEYGTRSRLVAAGDVAGTHEGYFD